MPGFPNNHGRTTYDEFLYVLERGNTGISSRHVAVSFQEITVWDVQIQRILNSFCIFCIFCWPECYVVKPVSTGDVYMTCIYIFMLWGLSDLCLYFPTCFSLMFTSLTWFPPLILFMLCFVQFRQVVQGYQRKRRLRLNYKVRCFVFQLI